MAPQELCKYTDEKHPDYDLVKQAYTKIDGLLTEINRRIHEQKRLIDISTLQSSRGLSSSTSSISVIEDYENAIGMAQRSQRATVCAAKIEVPTSTSNSRNHRATVLGINKVRADDGSTTNNNTLSKEKTRDLLSLLGQTSTQAELQTRSISTDMEEEESKVDDSKKGEENLESTTSSEKQEDPSNQNGEDSYSNSNGVEIADAQHIQREGETLEDSNFDSHLEYVEGTENNDQGELTYSSQQDVGTGLCYDEESYEHEVFQEPSQVDNSGWDHYEASDILNGTDQYTSHQEGSHQQFEYSDAPQAYNDSVLQNEAGYLVLSHGEEGYYDQEEKEEEEIQYDHDEASQVYDPYNTWNACGTDTFDASSTAIRTLH